MPNWSLSLRNRPEADFLLGCDSPSPCHPVLLKFFCKALVEAKGYKLPSSSSGGGGGTRGRQAEFKTRVHGNGNLLIGHAYTRRLGLEPGQEFRIELRQDSRSIWLHPMNNEELKVAEVGSEPDQDTTKGPG